MNLDCIYQVVQRMMKKHSVNNKISTKKALFVLGMTGIPKDKRYLVLHVMYERELLKRMNQGCIEIINLEESEHVEKSFRTYLWNAVLEDK